MFLPAATTTITIAPAARFLDQRYAFSIAPQPNSARGQVAGRTLTYKTSTKTQTIPVHHTGPFKTVMLQTRSRSKQAGGGANDFHLILELFRSLFVIPLLEGIPWVAYRASSSIVDPSMEREKELWAWERPTDLSSFFPLHAGIYTWHSVLFFADMLSDNNPDWCWR